MTTRPITANERAALAAGITKSRATWSERNGLLVGPALTLILVLVGLGMLIRWVARTLFDDNLGLQSPVAPWLLMAGESECPALAKEESVPMEAAVCLKEFPCGYVLGVSDKVKDPHIWLPGDR